MNFKASTQEWRIVSVEEIKADTPNALATGPFGSSIGPRFFETCGVPLIRGTNLSEDISVRLNHKNIAFISMEKSRDFERSKVRKGDLVFTSRGSVGQVGLIDKNCPYPEYVISNNMMKLSPDLTKVDSNYLYYLFSSPIMSDEIKNQTIGTSVPGFNLGQLRSIKILLPPLPEQRAIARILGSLDDKIEANRRMNETLEAMARAVFKSWFVDFDPVRARAEGRVPAGMDAGTAALFPDGFEEKDGCEVPMGWRLGILDDIGKNPRRVVDPSKIPPDTPYIGLEHMPCNSIALNEWGSSDGLESNKFQFEKGDILFGKLRPYFHKVGVAPVNGVCSTDILVITPKKECWFSFVLGHVSSDIFVHYADAASTGTKMPRTNWQDMAAYKIVIPSEKVASIFNSRIKQIAEKILSNVHQSYTLSAMCNLLLPKLLSGEVSIKFEKEFLDEEQE